MKMTTSRVSDTEKYISLQDGTGHAHIQVYQVFPGVELAYRNISMKQCPMGNPKDGTFLEIHYCREGRMEYCLENDCHYLFPGDLSVFFRRQAPQTPSFPTGHYRGISVGIHMETAPQCFSCFLKDVKVQPRKIACRLCSSCPFFILHSQAQMKSFFSALYEVPESQRAGYLKIKVMELLYILNGISEETPAAAVSSAHGQLRLARSVSAHLKENLDEKITVSELARQFHISARHLQTSFKSVYGVSVFSYIKVLKMQEAAHALAETELPVLEIAARFGYNNPSKFSSAFQKVIGKTPLEYRKAHRRF